MLKTVNATFLLLLLMLLGTTPTFASGPDGDAHEEDPIEAMMHHLGDANEFHLAGDWAIPLPCMAWDENGFMFTMSSAFEHGHKAVNGYVLHHGIMMRVLGADFPKETVAVTFGHSHGQDQAKHGHADAHLHDHNSDQLVNVDGIKDGQVVANDNNTSDEDHGSAAKDKEEVATVATVLYNGKSYPLEACMSLQNTSSTWQDFSITKNVFGMLLALILMIIVFSMISKAYAKRTKQAPKGLQSFFEPIFMFMRDEVVKPAVGEKDWKRFFPFIMCLFFFILFCNLLGLVPFFPGSANITGNIGVTMVLALIVFIVVNLNGTKDYWMHILWMPGIPTAVKPLLTIIEVMSLFIKPATLFIRLFANITAGHVIILSLVSLIFFFKTSMGMGGAVGGMAIAVPFVFAMNMLELFVAFLQAFVFALLTALYIGGAVESHEHDHPDGENHDYNEHATS